MSRSPRPFLLPEPAQSKQMEADSYNNWNRSFVRVYDDAKRDSDVVLLTGDLIDYGRGHWGVQARDRQWRWGATDGWSGKIDVGE